MNNIIKEIENLKTEVPNEYHHHLDYVITKLIERKNQHNKYANAYYHKNNEKCKEYQKNYAREHFKKPITRTEEQLEKYKEYQKEYYLKKKQKKQSSDPTGCETLNASSQLENDLEQNEQKIEIV